MTVPILSEYSATNLALAGIDERIVHIKDELAVGTPQNYEQYMHLVGQIRGLYEARHELLDALKKIE